MITNKKQLGIVVALTIIIILFSGNAYGKKLKEVSSADLKSTTIVPTLDSPMSPNTNTIWCSSLQYAWNKLKDNVIEEDVIIEGAEQLSDQLNTAINPPW